jgi:hypothetical protein
MKATSARRPYRRIPFKDQLRRRRELDEIRMVRPLTAEERAEDLDLANRAYQRIYRQDYSALSRSSGAR